MVFFSPWIDGKIKTSQGRIDREIPGPEIKLSSSDSKSFIIKSEAYFSQYNPSTKKKKFLSFKEKNFSCKICELYINWWMDKQEAVFSYNGKLAIKKEWSTDTCRNMGEPWKHT